MKRRKILVWLITLSLLLSNFTMPAYAAEVETETEESTVENVVSETIEELTTETTIDEKVITEEMTEISAEEGTSGESEEESVAETTESDDETEVEIIETMVGEETEEDTFDDVRSYGSWYWPVPGYTSLSQGYHANHKAIDIPAPLGTPICAAKAGTIRLVINNCEHEKLSNRGECVHYVNGYAYTDGGNQVYITHDDGTYSIYAHMVKGSISVTAGERVSAGQQIGQMGQSGFASGIHLHFGVSVGGTSYWTGTIIDPMTLSFDSSGSSTASLLTNTGVTDITDTTAKINATLPGIYNISEAGFYYGTSADNMTKVVEATSGNVRTAFYTLGDGKWCGALTPGTTYYYKIYVIINGVTHMSAIDSFTTTGTSYNDPASFPLQDGKYYYIKNRNAGLVLDIENMAEGVGVILGSKSTSNACQMWKAVKHADGYSFINYGTGYAMDVYGYSTDNLAEIKQYAYHGNTNQRFKLIDRGSGYYSIHPICSGLGLDAYEAGTAVGTKIVQYGYHGGNNMQWSFEAVDDVKPVVTSAYISQYDADGYTVVATASDNIGLQKVEFATWYEGQDVSSVKWYQGTLNADGTYSCRINVSDFGSKQGKYYTDVYAWDYTGNPSVPKNFIQYIDRTQPVITERKAERISDNLVKISCKATDDTGVVSMYFPTWTDSNGQDDLQTDWETYYKGKKEGDWWVFYVHDYDHNYEKGNYTTHIYPYDAYNNHCSGGIGYSFANRYQPQTFTYGNHTYELYNDLLSWDEAKAKCEALGGHLVTINSQDEQNAIATAISQGIRTYYFIGGKTVNKQPTWITGEAFEYSNWYPNEPNNYGGAQGHYVFRQIDEMWADVNNNLAGVGFICEYEPDAVLPDDIPEDTIPEGLWIAGIDEDGYIYTGKSIKPEVRVYDHDTRLQQGKDYTITYKNNKKVNDASNEKTAPTIIVKGKGNYSSQETATFKILPKNISDSDITADDIVLKYNQKTLKPIPVVKCDGKKLKNKTDFTVEYVELAAGVAGANKNPGTYTIRITGKGGYTGERTVAFTITENKLISTMTVSKVANQKYTGSAITPAITVKNGKTPLIEGTDYTVSYQNNIAVGTAAILIKGKGSYSGEKKVTFKITGTAINRASASGIPASVPYTGSAITVTSSTWGTAPVLTMTVNGENKTLQEGTDYVIGYKNNAKVGTASIIFKGINGYTGSLKKNFTIAPYDIETDPTGSITAGVASSVVYAKGGSRPEPIVKFGSSVLTKGKDYTLSYANNTKVNDGSNPDSLPTVTVKGKGNYKGSISLTFTITKQSISKLAITAPDKVYKKQKNAYKTTPKITDLNGKVLKAGTDYEKTFTYLYKNAVTLADGTLRSAGSEVGAADIVPAGTVLIVKVQGKGNYADSVLTGEYRITRSSISQAAVKVKPQIYTGSEIKPSKEDITVKIGKTTLSSTDYEIVGYSNNIKKGNAKITIKGVDNYGGTKTVTFKIKSKGFLWWWR